MTPSKSAPSGFTLIEIIIVLVLIAVITTMALPRLDLGRYRADGAMRAVQGVLQQAERNSVQRQTDVMISFDTANARVRAVYDINNNHAVDVGEVTRWTSLEEGNVFATPPLGVNGAASRAVVGANISVSPDGYPTVYYHRDGASSSNIEIYLRAASSTNLNSFRALLVTQATGRVDLYRYGSGKWLKVGL